MKLYLIEHGPCGGEDWFFRLSNGKTIVLKEKSDWPVIMNQPNYLVERWLFREYALAVGLVA